MILYQYRGQIANKVNFSYFKDLLCNGAIKFTKPSDFNDPFDCCPTQIEELPENTFPQAVGDSINQSIQSIISVMLGVACFTPHPDCMLMWSHYGDQHRGVCVGFDTELLLANAPRNSEGNPLYEDIVEVKYTSIRPKSGDRDMYYKKSDEWKYENEYRIISTMKKGIPSWGAGVWNIPICAIKEVIIGARVPSDLKENIINLIKTISFEIAIKIVVLHMERFELLIENYDDQPKVAQGNGWVLGPNGDWIKT